MAKQQIYEGTWEQVKLHDQDLSGQQVRLVILHSNHSEEPVATGTKMITLGMFPQSRDLTEEDFKLAEWRGEDLDI